MSSKRRAGAVVAVILLGASTEAHAWQIAVYSLGFSLELSSKASTQSSGEQSAGKKKKGKRQKAGTSKGLQRDGASCTFDGECLGRCEGAVCVNDPAHAVAQPPQPQSPSCETDEACGARWVCRGGRCAEPLAPVELNTCLRDEHCLAGRRCIGGQCLSGPPSPPQMRPRSVDLTAPEPPPDGCEANQSCDESAPPPPRLPVERCSEACGAGRSCVDGHCLTAPPLAPSTLLAPELYLRHRAVQLREELALGAGPVISMLATVHGLSPGALGRAMRAHRAELIALMGDGSDPGWAREVLLALSAFSPTLSPAETGT